MLQTFEHFVSGLNHSRFDFCTQKPLRSQRLVGLLEVNELSRKGIFYPFVFPVTILSQQGLQDHQRHAHPKAKGLWVRCLRYERGS